MKKMGISILVSLASLLLVQPVAAEIKDALYRDSASYRAFLDLGKAACLDDLIQQTRMYQIQKKDSSLFVKHFDTLYFLQSALAYNYRDTDMKKTFATYQKQHVGSLIARYREREEYFNIRRSPLLICSKLFAENAETKKLYRDFLYAPGHLLNLDKQSRRQMENKIGRWHDNPQPLED